MVTAHRRLPLDAPTDRLPEDLPEVPEGWRRIDDREELTYMERAAWVHEATGQRVNVRRRRKPTQMHTPETSTDDTGYVACVSGDHSRGRLTYDLASKAIAYEAAVRFMDRYPDAEYEVPSPDDRPWFSEKLEWDDE